MDGLDELTTTDLSAVYEVKDGTVRETHIDPGKLGSRQGSARANSRAATRRTTPTSPGACSTARPGAQRDVVLLNAGAALKVAGFAETLDEGMATAARAIDDGDAAKTLTRWVEVSNAG